MKKLHYGYNKRIRSLILTYDEFNCLSRFDETEVSPENFYYTEIE